MNTSQLIDQNIKFAKFLAAKYSNGQNNFDDILQETLIGFHEAAQNFNSERGKFTTIARLYAKNRIFKYLAKNKYPIALPLDKFLTNTTEKQLIFCADNFESKDSETFIDIPQEIKKESKDYKQIISQYLDILTTKEQIIIKLTLGLEDNISKSDIQIAEITKNSINHIQNIRRSATQKLSCAVGRKPLKFEYGA